mgnify:CR=1 FL=1
MLSKIKNKFRFKPANNISDDNLKELPTVVFFTGAGISEESGLQTYRGSNGLWKKSRFAKLSTQKAYKDNPEDFFEFYKDRQIEIQKTSPNSAHKLISEFDCEPDFKKHVITQNIDDLHERSGTNDIIHLHGKINDLRCRGCSEVFYQQKLENKKYCDNCGSLLGPDVVLYGENVSRILFDECKPIMAKAKHLIIVGASLKVFPATHLLDYIKKDCYIWIIDPNNIEMANNSNNVFKIKKKASDGLEEVLNDLKSYVF